MLTLCRRVQGLEEDLEKCEDKLLIASQKLDKASTAADDSERMRKVSYCRCSHESDKHSVWTRSIVLKELKKSNFFLVARPLRGGRDKGRATKKK